VTTDPFDTAALRDSVLTAWRGSPTRFREDANAEDDLRVGGYRDRLLVELAQNAGDAAAQDGVAGVLWLRVVYKPYGPELRAANTGAPLDADGVAALASLRASAKRAGHQVGRFGVGFAAVLAVTEAPRVVSASGGVAFDADRTRAELAEHEKLAELLAMRSDEVPVLRLVWPVDPDEDPVPPGFRTDVRLPLRPGVDPDELVAQAERDAADLLLALPTLHTIRVGERRWTRVDEPDGVVRLGTGAWLTRRATGTLTDEQAGQLGVEARTRPEWSVCWALALAGDGTPTPAENDVLHAPTPTDERLSLPARLFATLPIESNRRRLLPGPAATAVLDAAADAYLALVRGLDGPQRTVLVPRPGFPLSEVDEQLRDAIMTRLNGTGWLPAQRRGLGDLTPGAARCLDVPDAELADLLVDVVPGLAAWWLAGPEHVHALATLGVRRLRPADLATAVSGVDRSPSWWAALYTALSRLPDTGSSLTDELGALPVPLIDGRMAIGPRDVLLPSPELGELVAGADVAGLRIAHPAARHPLLERLGARPADAADLLAAPAIRDAVDRAVADANAGLSTDELAGVVLRLVAASNLAPGEQPWLGALALPDADGNPRRADELLFPDAPLLDVLAADALGPDSALGVLADDVAAEWPVDVLRAVGVLDSFALVRDENPIGPDHDLADEAAWWETVADRPGVTLVGIRDLDLVDADAWPAALKLLGDEPETRRALADPRGYPAWWLARYALLDGRPPRDWRLASAADLAGLYDVVPDTGLTVELLAELGVRSALAVSDREQAADLLARLGDPDRDVPIGLAMRAHAALADAAQAEVFDPAEVDPPDAVRTFAGTVVPAEDAAVLDRPWLLPVVGADHAVAARPSDLDGPLADLLNVPLAGELIADMPSSAGEPVAWSDLGAVVLACSLLDVPVPSGSVVVHDELVVADRRVPWWVNGDAVVHTEDSPDGMARALAWAADRWADRWQLAAILDDPMPTTALF